MLFGLCVDCMPTEGCAMPDDDALRRVAALATCTRTLRQLNPSTEKLYKTAPKIMLGL